MHNASTPMPTHWIPTLILSCRRVTCWNAMQALWRVWSMTQLLGTSAKVWVEARACAALPSFVFAIWWSGRKLWQLLPMDLWWIHMIGQKQQHQHHPHGSGSGVVTMIYLFWWMLSVVTTAQQDASQLATAVSGYFQLWRSPTSDSMPILFVIEIFATLMETGFFNSWVCFCSVRGNILERIPTIHSIFAIVMGHLIMIPLFGHVASIFNQMSLSSRQCHLCSHIHGVCDGRSHILFYGKTWLFLQQAAIILLVQQEKRKSTAAKQNGMFHFAKDTNLWKWDSVGQDSIALWYLLGW